MKISVITPSTRNEMLPVIEKCLKRQTFLKEDFEWIVVSPIEITSVKPDLLLKDPPKKEGDYYSLCAGWNLAFAHAKGELIVNIQDGIWFPPDFLERFWFHYESHKNGLVTAIGHQYSTVDETGKPQNIAWQDPRSRLDFGSFYEVAPSEMEMAVCSMPRQAYLDSGGIDEVYDKGAAVGEKEMCYRLDRLGYKFFIDQLLEYRAIQHPRLSVSWNEKYKISSDIFRSHVAELNAGTRTLKVNQKV